MIPQPMTLYAGAFRDEEIPVEVTPLDCGAGKIDRLECDGTGIWTYLPPDNAPVPCTTCKGTGQSLVSIQVGKQSGTIPYSFDYRIMYDDKNQLPQGEFRKNADRDVTVGPHGPPPDEKGPKVEPIADKVDWAEMDRRQQEKIQRGQQPDRVASLANFHLAIDAVEEVIEEGLEEGGADAGTKVSRATGRPPKARQPTKLRAK